MFDKATDVIKQGGRRRGANMAILSVDHADAIAFILCKTRPGFLENFNISVSATDAFMEAVEHGGEHAFVNPRTGEATERRPAREVFDLICSAAWQCGDPGLVFMDEVNRHNPLRDAARIEADEPLRRTAAPPVRVVQPRQHQPHALHQGNRRFPDERLFRRAWSGRQAAFAGSRRRSA